MGEALQAMATDGTGALAWGFDPAEQPLSIDELDRAEASRLLAAGYAVRRVLGVHPVDDVIEPDRRGAGRVVVRRAPRSPSASQRRLKLTRTIAHESSPNGGLSALEKRHDLVESPY